MLKICEKADVKVLQSENLSFSDDVRNEIDYFKLRDRIYKLGETFDKAGKEEVAHSVVLLAHVLGMGLDLKEPGEPFRALATWDDGSRTILPQDLTDAHLDVLEEFTKRASNPAILARIYDLLWLKRRPTNRVNADKAIENYLALADQIRKEDRSKLIYSRKYLERAIQLWAQVGKDVGLRKKIENLVEESLFLAETEPRNAVRAIIFELIPLCMDSSDLKKWADITDLLCDEAIKQKNFDKARSYARTGQDIYRMSKDKAGVAKLKERETDYFVLEAREMKAAGLDPMVLQTLFTKAIEACRQTPGKTQTAKDLQTELVEIQKPIPGALKEASVSVDLRPAIEETLERLRSRSFEEALRIIGYKTLPAKKSELWKQADKMIKDFPFQSLVTNLILDEKGKVIASRPGMVTTAEQKGALLKSRAAQDLLVAFELKGHVIRAAQTELWQRTDFSEEVVEKLLYPNPFIPTSRIIQFKRGILCGLKGDWISSVHILVPQIENSLRTIMQMAGHNMVTMDSEGNQKEKDLKAFIYSTEFATIVGEDMQFQLQVLLTDKSGVNLRNAIAHGLATDGLVLSNTSAFTWALTILFCIHFQQQFIREQMGEAEKSGVTKDEDITSNEVEKEP